MSATATEVDIEQKGVPGVLKEALEPLFEVLPAYKAEEEGLEAQLAAKREERKCIERTLRSAGLLKTETKPEASKPLKIRKGSTGFGSTKMLARLEKAASELPSGPFSIRDLSERAGVSNPTTTKRGLEGLKEMGVVRLVGMRPLSYKPDTKALHYAYLGDA